MPSLFARPFQTILACFAVAAFLIPSTAFARTNQEVLCARPNCTANATACPGGAAECRRTTEASGLCGGNYVCLNDRDYTCLQSASCRAALEGQGYPSGSGTGAPTPPSGSGNCCSCQKTVNSQTNQGFFRLLDAPNCANFTQSPTVLGTRTAADFTGVACQEAVSCTNPQEPARLYDVMNGTPTAPTMPSAESDPNRGGLAAFTAPAPPFRSITPQLGVQIPGLTFSPAQNDEGTVTIPFLSQYIAGVYRYAIGIVALLATIMVVYGGFRYLMGSATGDLNRGKEIITDAITGMLVVLGAYIILATVNENLVSFGTFQLTNINRVMDREEEIDFSTQASSNGPPQTSAVTYPPPRVSNSGRAQTVPQQAFQRMPDSECMHIGTPVHPLFIPILQATAQRFCQLRPQGSTWRIVGGGFRHPNTQLRMWIDRCWGRGPNRGDSRCTLATCGPLPRAAADAIRQLDDSTEVGSGPSAAARQQAYNIAVSQVDPTQCPHTSGVAVDVYCSGASRGELSPFVPCQLLLERAFLESGACRLRHETWHFEPNQYRVSGTSCITDQTWIGKVQKPRSANAVDYSTCAGIWSYDRERCLQ